MSSGHRSALIALLAALAAIVLVAWFGQPSRTQVRLPNAEQGRAENANRQPVETVHWGLFATKDTYAQWLMAIFSVAATGVSVWAVRLLRDTLEATREAVRAADDAVKVTREIGERQLRAYLAVEGATDRFDLEADEPITLRFKVRNVGHTPAHNVAVSKGVAIRGRSWEGPGYAGAPPDEAPRGVLMPGQEFVFLISSLDGNGWVPDSQNVDNIRAGKQTVYVFGEVVYLDAISIEERRTRFQFEISQGALNAGRIGFSRTGNSAT